MTLICTAIALAIMGQEIVLAAPRGARVEPLVLPKRGGGLETKERANEPTIRAHEFDDAVGLGRARIPRAHPAPTDKEEPGHLHLHTDTNHHNCPPGSFLRSDRCGNE